jgi:hypothetical protein
MATSRIKQMEKIQAKAAKLAEEVEALKDEFEEAFENMPENLQYNSEKGERAQERINVLDTWQMALDEIAEEGIE